MSRFPSLPLICDGIQFFLHKKGPEMSGNCSYLVAEEFNNTSSVEPASWSYGNCPDVEECRLKLDDCHENATCHNTFDSYICECNRGFTGNGKDTCNRTYVICENSE